jgi:hypothetical protein
VAPLVVRETLKTRQPGEPKQGGRRA